VKYLSELRITAVGALAALLSAASAGLAAALVPPVRGAVEPLVVTAVLVALTSVWTWRVAPRALPTARRWVPAVAALAGVLAVLLAGPLRWIGAVAFAVCAAGAAGLRRIGGRPAAIGVLAVGPLAAVLAAPLAGNAAIWHALVLTVVVIAALAWTHGLVRVGSRRFGLVPQPAPRRVGQGAEPWQVARCAAAAGVGVAAAFIASALLFPQHAGWAPLTALVVGAGSVTWNDSVRRGALRLVGATVGALVASLLLLVPLPAAVGPVVFVALATVAVLIGSGLRAAGYAWWAGGLTAALILAADDPSGPGFALSRVLAVLVGGLLAIVAGRALLPGEHAPGRSDRRAGPSA
jgi:hypothetical protein